MEQRNNQTNRDREIVRIVETYSDMLMRIALNRMNGIAEAEDVVQSTSVNGTARNPRSSAGTSTRNTAASVSPRPRIERRPTLPPTSAVTSRKTARRPKISHCRL